MTDREILEMAAKAAGLRVRLWDGHTRVLCAIDDDRHGRMWMPLIDDGDALRLAIKLRMLVDLDDLSVNGLYFEAGEDRRAAIRRAITCAAAEIGRAAE